MTIAEMYRNVEPINQMAHAHGLSVFDPPGDASGCGTKMGKVVTSFKSSTSWPLSQHAQNLSFQSSMSLTAFDKKLDALGKNPPTP